MSRLNLLLLTLTLAFAVITAIWFYPVQDDFRVSNTSWNGLSKASATLNATTIDSLSRLPAKEQGTALLLIPYDTFTLEELNRLESYVLDGGTLILMDDYGNGNDVLEKLGVAWRFAKTPLLDPLLNYRNENFPTIANFNDVPFVSETDVMVLNHGTCLIGVPQDQVVASSSHFSFLDTDGDRVYNEEDEQKGPFTVIAYTVLGEGNLIAISDPSFIINSMIDVENNYDILYLATMISTTKPVVYLTQSHLTESAFFKTKTALGNVRNALAHPAVLSGVVGAVMLLVLSPTRNTRR